MAGFPSLHSPPPPPRNRICKLQMAGRSNTPSASSSTPLHSGGVQSLEQTLTDAISRAIRETLTRPNIQVRDLS